MSCWTGHVPGMSDAQLAQALEAYYRAAYSQAWEQRWHQQPWAPADAAHVESPVYREPRRTTSLAPARAEDKVQALDVEFARLR